MFLILFMEYSGKNILKVIHSNYNIGLLRGKKDVLNDFSDNTWSYYILTQIWLDISHFDPDCHIQPHFEGRRKLFWEECTLGIDSTLNFISESSINSIFVFLEILCFKIRLLTCTSRSCSQITLLNRYYFHATNG